nr:alpha/beta hydrolase [Sphingomonas horti]
MVVLHGANSSAREMAPLTDRFPPQAQLFVPDLLGHGGRGLAPELSVAAIAADALRQCDEHGLGRADWFGYSFGGLVALWVAAHHPERVRSVATLAAKIAYDERAVSHVTHLLDSERLAAIPRGTQLASTHAPQDWRALAQVNRAMFARFASEPPLDATALRQVHQPVLLMASLEDPLVTAAETRALAHVLPNAMTGLFPGSCHPLPQAPLDTVLRTLARFRADPDGMVRAARSALLSYWWADQGGRA